MNVLQKALIDRKPSEKGGQIAEERFGYQKDWAICKLIELHQSAEDYIMVFEYHDDILVLDSSINPSQISFYQIKTKTSGGNWTINNLTKKPKDKNNSFIGKLYLNRINFPEFNSKLHFVSNARFSFKLKDAKKDSTNMLNISCRDLAKEELGTINNSLKIEFPAITVFTIDKETYFNVSDISVQKSEDNVIASLVKYFEDTTTDFFIPRLRPLHETLHNEIRRKSKYSFDVTSFDELINCRSFTREEFQNILTHALKSRSLDLNKIKDEILSRLNSERVSMKTIQLFNKWSYEYLIEKLNIANKVTQRLEKEIQLIIASLSDEEFDQELLPCANMVQGKFASQFEKKYSLDKNYVFVVILFQIYGNQQI